MCKKFQLASREISSPEQISDALLRGSHEMSQFPELFQGIPAKTKHVVQTIIDRVRVLQLEKRKVEIQLDHCLERRDEKDDSVSK